jgi:hypothetical protein
MSPLAVPMRADFSSLSHVEEGPEIAARHTAACLPQCDEISFKVSFDRSASLVRSRGRGGLSKPSSQNSPGTVLAFTSGRKHACTRGAVPICLISDIARSHDSRGFRDNA